MAEKYNMPILYSCHPRSKKRLENSGFKLDNRVIQHEPLGFHDYTCLQMNAFVVVSDSGTLPEESSFFTSVGHPFPAVCIRTSTERPEALDKGCFIIAGIDEVSLLQAVDTSHTACSAFTVRDQVLNPHPLLKKRGNYYLSPLSRGSTAKPGGSCSHRKTI